MLEGSKYGWLTETSGLQWGVLYWRGFFCVSIICFFITAIGSFFILHENIRVLAAVRLFAKYPSFITYLTYATISIDSSQLSSL